MALPLETSQVQDDYARRALERIGLQFPIQDLNLASPNNAAWAPYFRAEAMRTINATGTAIVIGANVDGIPSGGAGNNIANVLHLTAADLAVSGKTTQMRVRAIVACNATAPACTFTYALCPVAPTGGAGVISFTAGAPVGNTAAIVTPVASQSTGGVGAAFTIPADGAYVLTAQASVAQAANSFTVHNIVLEYRYA